MRGKGLFARTDGDGEELTAYRRASDHLFEALRGNPLDRNTEQQTRLALAFSNLALCDRIEELNAELKARRPR